MSLPPDEESDATPADAAASLERIYAELRAMAHAHLRGDRRHTLQPTALVHEVWLRIAKLPELCSTDERRYLAVAGRAMRSVLVDHARRHLAQKRDRARLAPVTVGALLGKEIPIDDVLAVAAALERLEQVDPELAETVDLLFFCGLTAAEAAAVLGTSSRTVERRWRFARAWLRTELEGEGP